MEVPSASRASPRRRRAAPDGDGGSSCDILLQLAQRAPVADLLRGYGVTPELLESNRRRLEHAAAEPVDWRARLAQRQGAGTTSDPALEQLLAIVRSAESHAYQLLESVGVPCTRLRRRIIERLRDHGTQGTPSTRPSGKPSHPVVAARVRERRAAPKNGTVRQTRSVANSVTAESRPSPRRSRAGSEPLPCAAARPGSMGLATPRVVQRNTAPPRVAMPDPATSPLPEVDRSATAAPTPDRSESTTTTAKPQSPRIEPVQAGDLPPLYGRASELARLADAVLRRSPRGPVLVGPAGVGKTLLAKHLAHVLSVPVFHLEAPLDEDDDRLTDALQQVAVARGVAIVDDLDHVTGDAAPLCLQALAQAWSSGEPHVVTVLSPAGWERVRAWAPGLATLLDVLPVPPLTGPALDQAIDALAPRILAQHGLTFASDIDLEHLARVAQRYWTGLASPGNIADLLDLACARTVRRGETVVQSTTWLELVAERVGLSTGRLQQPGDEGMLDLERQLAQRVVGHEPVLRTLAGLIRRNRAGFAGTRPVATALLLGPSGVGKTEIAKAVAAALFEHEDALVRLDMSEYAEPHAVARIVGAPPGYVGHELGGALTDPLARRAHCVILLDEIEKAHRDVHQLLLQVLDEGRLTDGRGRLIDFRHAVIVMTSNLGGELCRHADDPQHEPAVLAAARAAFPVELWNRIEAPLVLGPLSPPQMDEICQRLAQTSSERLFAERGIRYALTDAARALLVGRAGRDPSLGARPLRHWLAREVEALLADAILRGRVHAGTQALVDADGERLYVR